MGPSSGSIRSSLTSSRPSLSTYDTRPRVNGSSAPPNRRRDFVAFFATPRFLPRSSVRNTTMRSASPYRYVRRTIASATCVRIRKSLASLLALGQTRRRCVKEPDEDRGQTQEREEAEDVRQRGDEHRRRERRVHFQRAQAQGNQRAGRGRDEHVDDHRQAKDQA